MILQINNMKQDHKLGKKNPSVFYHCNIKRNNLKIKNILQLSFGSFIILLILIISPISTTAAGDANENFIDQKKSKISMIEESQQIIEVFEVNSANIISSLEAIHNTQFGSNNHSYVISNEEFNPVIYGSDSDGWRYAMKEVEVLSTDSFDDSNYPNFVIDKNDNIHVVWSEGTYAFSETDPKVFYKYYDATTSEWKDHIMLFSESIGHYSSSPVIDVDSKGNLHVVWTHAILYETEGGRTSDFSILHKFYNSTVSEWESASVVHAETNKLANNNQISIDTKDNLHLIWSDRVYYENLISNHQIVYKSYNITTNEWDSTTVVSTESTAFVSLPRLAIDSKDNMHVVWFDETDYAIGSANIAYKLFNATISQWGNTTLISPEIQGYSDSIKIASDSQDNLHVLWSLAGDDFLHVNHKMYYSFYNTTSVEWEEAIELSYKYDNSRHYYPDITIDRKNNLHIVWNEEVYFEEIEIIKAVYKIYNSTTFKWEEKRVLSTETHDYALHPKIAVDSMDNLHVVWTDSTHYNSAGGDFDIFYKKLELDLYFEYLEGVENFIYEAGSSDNLIEWLAIDKNPGRFEIYHDGNLIITDKWQSNTTISVSVGNFSFGTHNVTIKAYDLVKNYAKQTVFVTVVDTTPPVIASHPKNKMIEQGSSNNWLHWTAIDLYPDQYEIFHNNERIILEDWESNVTVSVNIDNLEIGEHNFTIQFFDLSNNFATNIVIVHVEDTDTTNSMENLFQTLNFSIIVVPVTLLMAVLAISIRRKSFSN
jgi:hypothetical protein